MDGFRPLRPIEPVAHSRVPEQSSHVVSPISPATARSFAPPKQRRTCLQCRVRKVRCDGRPSTCRNCERLVFDCSFLNRQTTTLQYPGSNSGSSTPKLPERRRRMQACLACRGAKIRCLGELPGCANCARKGLACAYPAAKKTSPSNGQGQQSGYGNGSGNGNGVGLMPPSATQQESPRGSVDMDMSTVAGGDTQLGQDTAIELVEQYFQHLYPLPSYAFLHRATVLQRCRDGTMAPPLQLAICAITAQQLQKHLPSHSHSLHSAAASHALWAHRAEHLLLAHLGRPTISNLQALLLVIRHRIESGAFPTAFMLAALAGRAAVALRLNYERSTHPDEEVGLSPLVQEARRRLFWALYLLDDYFSVGIREFELWPRETVHLRLPGGDGAFEEGRACWTGGLDADVDVGGNGVDVNELAQGQGQEQQSTTTSLRGVFLRIVSVRRAVMRFARRVNLGELDPGAVHPTIARFERQLDGILGSGSNSLSATERTFSVANLAASPLPAQFVLLHASWHQCFCDLYRLFLEGYAEAAPGKVLCQLKGEGLRGLEGEGVEVKEEEARGAMRRECLRHAEQILRVVAEFGGWCAGAGVEGGEEKGPPLLLERDTAVCAYESARIVLFATSTSTTSGMVGAREAAVGRARGCWEVVRRFFEGAASVRSLMDKFDLLIQSHAARLAQQHRDAVVQDHPEPYLGLDRGGMKGGAGTQGQQGQEQQEQQGQEQEQGGSSRVSRYAASRQKLSVQSLLLQADFVDDSDELALPTSAGANASVHERRGFGGERERKEMEEQAARGSVVLPVPDGVGNRGVAAAPAFSAAAAPAPAVADEDARCSLSGAGAGAAVAGASGAGIARIGASPCASIASAGAGITSADAGIAGAGFAGAGIAGIAGTAAGGAAGAGAGDYGDSRDPGGAAAAFNPWMGFPFPGAISGSGGGGAGGINQDIYGMYGLSSVDLGEDF